MGDDKIVKVSERKPFRPGVKLVGLAARKAAAIEKAIEDNSEHVPTLPPDKMPDRIGIVFDDSGSMDGQLIRDAHDGVEEFLRSCKPTTTAVTVYPMNAGHYSLCTTLPALAQLVRGIKADGGTPAVHTLDNMLTAENLTRAIMFSDGSFTMYEWEMTRQKCKAKEIAVDTVFIGYDSATAIANLKKIAEDTGGIFLHFIPGKSSFARAFKYLSPGMRLMLMDDNFKAKVERGEV